DRETDTDTIVFRAYLDGKKNAPLEVFWRAPNMIPSPVALTCDSYGVNLNTPGMARILIEHGLAHGWTPELNVNPLVLKDGPGVLHATGCSLPDWVTVNPA
ncbi:MAG: hypothetical protein AAF386_09585, partial [Pseudomonadota bacterium]